jgi:hypothetical protein
MFLVFLSFALIVEAQRQAARQAGDWPRHASCELELAKLGLRAVELERQRGSSRSSSEPRSIMERA